MLVATAHGNELDTLLKNPALSDLVGGACVCVLVWVSSHACVCTCVHACVFVYVHTWCVCVPNSA